MIEKRLGSTIRYRCASNFFLSPIFLFLSESRTLQVDHLGDDGEKGTDASHKGLLKLPALDGVEKVPETTSASAEAEVKDGGAKGGGETPALPEATTSKKKRFGIFG